MAEERVFGRKSYYYCYRKNIPQPFPDDLPPPEYLKDGLVDGAVNRAELKIIKPYDYY